MQELNLITEPWPHIIIDNFLKKEHYDYLESHLAHLAALNSKPHHVYDNYIDSENVVNSSSLQEEFVRELQNSYHHVCMDILTRLAPLKAQLYTHSEFHLVYTKNAFSFPIHDDIPQKLLSCVVYLSPKENLGTYLYKKKHDKTPYTTVEWKQNRALFFSRYDSATWHSYSAKQDSSRLCLVYNLMTNRVRDVYKAESNSYLRYYIRSRVKRYFGLNEY
jgi:hypothetical protein